jgi:hypothetical protein
VTTGAAIVFLLPVEPLGNKNLTPALKRGDQHRYVRFPCGMRGPLAGAAEKVKGLCGVAGSK